MFTLHSGIHLVSAVVLCILTFGLVPKKLVYFENGQNEDKILKETIAFVGLKFLVVLCM